MLDVFYSGPTPRLFAFEKPAKDLDHAADQCRTGMFWFIHGDNDYTCFDFNYRPSPWEDHHLHVFPSQWQRDGHTYLANVKTVRDRVYNFHTDVTVPRQKSPLIIYINYGNLGSTKQFQKLKNQFLPIVSVNYDCELFQKIKLLVSNITDCWVISSLCDYSEFDFTWHPDLFQREMRHCFPTNSDARGQTFYVHVPSMLSQLGNQDSIEWFDCVNYCDDQVVHDLETSDITDTETWCPAKLDAIFISNGEPNEQELYERLRSLRSDVKWIKNVNGRISSLNAAAKISNTPWFFAIFAKLQVKDDFDWNWQPNYFQDPKHYIFQAENSLNQLVYGHQAVVAYNRDLVLKTTKIENLDFTMSQPHAVIDIVSGIAKFNQDPWTTWRTAFREVVKLMHYQNQKPSDENTQRLESWLNQANGEHAEWSLKGAHDAVVFFQKCGSNLELLEQTIEWSWLKNYFQSLYCHFGSDSTM
jgi:hypothetical protein